MSLLEVRDINTFYDKSHIIKGASLRVDEGEVVSLIGRNGAGKTTILRSIMRLTPPSSGTVLFCGQSTQARQPFELARRGIGFVFEDRRIFSNLSVRDNLSISVIERRGEKTTWTYDRIMEVFPLLKNLENHKGMHLSGGEQQILAIARTLMGNPILLLLDEPSEGLAPLIVKSLGELMGRIGKEITILLAEQNLKFALGFTDRVYIIGKGKIQYEGTRQELLNNEQIQQELLGV